MYIYIYKNRLTQVRHKGGTEEWIKMQHRVNNREFELPIAFATSRPSRLSIP